MEQKRVSFKVAKAIKEAGYPQKCDKFYAGTERYCVISERTLFEGYLVDRYEDRYLSDCAAPYAFDVWLWLWREKKFPIDVDCYNCDKWATDVNSVEFNDPEEAIIAAIEYVVDNNLLK